MWCLCKFESTAGFSRGAVDIEGVAVCGVRDAVANGGGGGGLMNGISVGFGVVVGGTNGLARHTNGTFNTGGGGSGG